LYFKKAPGTISNYLEFIGQKTIVGKIHEIFGFAAGGNAGKRGLLFGGRPCKNSEPDSKSMKTGQAGVLFFIL